MKQRFLFLTKCLALLFSYIATFPTLAQDYSTLEWWHNGKALMHQVKKVPDKQQTVAPNSEISTDSLSGPAVRIYFYCNDAFLNNFNVNFKSIGKNKDLKGLIFGNDTSTINLFDKDIEINIASYIYPISSFPAYIHIKTDISVKGSSIYIDGEKSIFIVAAQLLLPNKEPTAKEFIEVFSTKDIKSWKTFAGRSKLNKEYGIFDICIENDGTISKIQ